MLMSCKLWYAYVFQFVTAMKTRYHKFASGWTRSQKPCRVDRFPSQLKMGHRVPVLGIKIPEDQQKNIPFFLCCLTDPILAFTHLNLELALNKLRVFMCRSSPQSLALTLSPHWISSPTDQAAPDLQNSPDQRAALGCLQYQLGGSTQLAEIFVPSDLPMYLVECSWADWRSLADHGSSYAQRND